MNMNLSQARVSTGNMPGQATFNPARLDGHQTSDVCHHFGGPEDEVKARPRQFPSPSVVNVDNLGATLNEY
jgi:hypothetical protein